MIITTVLRTQEVHEGIFRTEYRVSSQITLDTVTTLSQGRYSITGHQYLSPVYLVQKPNSIEISGILQSNVIWVTYPAEVANSMEAYLSAILSLIPDQESAFSFLDSLYDDIRMYWRTIIRRMG